MRSRPAPTSELYELDVKSFESMREHVIVRPDLYGGSNKLMTRGERVLTSEGLKIVSVTSTAISRRLFHEALDNLRDASIVAKQKGLPIGRQEVVLSPRRVSVCNESAYIPIKQRVSKMKNEDGTITEKREWLVYVCFGRLMSSSNYVDDGTRVVVGQKRVRDQVERD